ncbi:hypothetical protein LMG7974_01907 [Campylobacter majalis]|uniref:Uncharacterized protein n=2 Tax=Campylobacter majalis TaxID=2790656 RepID=A0ABM8QAG6_9BACT|nr:hypothetical protein LMG7974_01907 [Campylobacter majalis]
MLGGAYGIIKSAKKLDKVDGEFVKSGNNTEVEIRFGNNKNQTHHVERHVIEKTNLNVEAVKQEIMRNFQKQNDKSKLKYNIKINNYSLEYRVHKLPDGTYNIGTIIVK